MGGQPGKPKPPGNPPMRPEPQEPKPIQEPPTPIPVPPVERPPVPIRADRVFAGHKERPSSGIERAWRNYPWASAVCSDSPVNFLCYFRRRTLNCNAVLVVKAERRSDKAGAIQPLAHAWRGPEI
jgi:hypothetical protein